jgi:hypothetical protein
MRKRLTRFEWQKSAPATLPALAYAILARAKREGWSKQIQSAKALAKRDDMSTAVTPLEAVSASIQQLG